MDIKKGLLTDEEVDNVDWDGPGNEDGLRHAADAASLKMLRFVVAELRAEADVQRQKYELTGSLYSAFQADGYITAAGEWQQALDAEAAIQGEQ